jgi:hypothetical protein
MKLFKTMLALVSLAVLAQTLVASTPVGLYALIDRVVLEPNDQSPERIQVWGSFALVDRGIDAARGTTKPKKGYLYFEMPPLATAAEVAAVRREWADLRAVAGTNQGVAFGSYRYVGAFDDKTTMYVAVRIGVNTWEREEVLVHPPSRRPSGPVAYVTNTGIVKLPATGSHAAVLSALKSSLQE